MAFASPGPGYDTSTTLLLGRDAAASAQVTASVPWTPTIGERLASKLTRWDAIYFSVAAERGYHYEQEWAFSWALNRFIARVVRFLPFADPSLVSHVWAAVIVSNLAHLLSISSLIRIASSVMAGIVTGSGFVIPQWLAYQQYCVRTLVLENSSEYLQLGPTALLERGLFAVLDAIQHTAIPPSRTHAVDHDEFCPTSHSPQSRFSGVSSATSEDLRKNSAEKSSMQVETPHLLVAFGLPQLALAALAVTNFHVQIVNRISSGYPVWYLAIASALGNTNGLQTTAIASKDASKSIFRLIIMYAVVQGALFASFLPPA
ncbi:ER membrane glycoprotein subunit of the GPI transamidase complex-like protein [Botryosphaeria dothidea]